MINVKQLAAALYGTWLVLKLDSRGLTYFEKTPAGFLRSFLVAACVAPLQLAHDAMVYHPARIKMAFLPFMIVQVLTFILSWVSFPFVMVYISDLLNRRERLFWQMVPYNWAQLAIALPLLSCAVLYDLHVISGHAFSNLSYFALLLFFIYGTFIAWAGLQVNIATAFGVAMLDFVMSSLTAKLISRIYVAG